MKKYLFGFLMLLLFCRSATAQNQASANLSASSAACVPATGCVALQVNSAFGGATFTLSGTFVVTASFEASGDGGATWVALNATPSNGTTAVTTATVPGTWQANVAGYTHVRIRPSAYTSGRIVANIQLSTASARAVGGGAGVAGVSDLNALTGSVTISAGTGITLTPSGNDISIAASGGGGGTPSAPANSVQFNNAGAFGGSADLLYAPATGLSLSTAGNINASGAGAGNCDGFGDACLFRAVQPSAVPYAYAETNLTAPAGNYSAVGIQNDGSAVWSASPDGAVFASISMLPSGLISLAGGANQGTEVVGPLFEGVSNQTTPNVLLTNFTTGGIDTLATGVNDDGSAFLLSTNPAGVSGFNFNADGTTSIKAPAVAASTLVVDSFSVAQTASLLDVNNGSTSSQPFGIMTVRGVNRNDRLPSPGNGGFGRAPVLYLSENHDTFQAVQLRIVNEDALVLDPAAGGIFETIANGDTALEFWGDASAGTPGIDDYAQISGSSAGELTFSGSFTGDPDAPFEFTRSGNAPSGNTYLQIDSAGGTGVADIGFAGGLNSSPAPILFPLATGLAGQALITDGANPQQTSWSSVPGIAGTGVFTARTTNVGATTLTTPAADGLYRITANVDCESTSAAATVLATISYKDMSGTAQTLATTAAACTALGAASSAGYVIAINAQAGTAISYTTTIANTPTYTVRIAAERIF